MARPIDTETKLKILELIRLECIKSGGPVSLTLKEIAREIGIGETRTEKIFRSLTALQKEGNIEIISGGGSVPNKYLFLNDNYSIAEDIDEDKYFEQDVIENVFKKLSNTTNDLFECYGWLFNTNKSLRRQLKHYAEIILQLEFHGTLADGTELFKVKKRGDSLRLTIEQIHKDISEGKPLIEPVKPLWEKDSSDKDEPEEK
jgi:plasmid maintenance system antidote protein VapI